MLAYKHRHVCLLAGQFRDQGLCPEEAAGRKAWCKHFAEMLVKWDVFHPPAALCCWAAGGQLSLQLSHRTSTRLPTPRCRCTGENCPQHLSQPLESAQGCSHGRCISHLRLVLSNFPLLLPHRIETLNASRGRWQARLSPSAGYNRMRPVFSLSLASNHTNLI